MERGRCKQKKNEMNALCEGEDGEGRGGARRSCWKGEMK